MKKIFSAAFVVALAVILSSCASKDIQTIQSLSGIEVNEIRIDEVNVTLGQQLADFYIKKINDEVDIITYQQERLDSLSDERTRRNKLTRASAEKAIVKSEEKKIKLEKASSDISIDVKKAILTEVANKFPGNKKINLNVTIESFTLTNAGAVMLIGGSDTMTGILKINDSQSGQLFGEYHITNNDLNSGLIGAMARGGDVREQMMEEFSEKISDILTGEYVDE